MTRSEAINHLKAWVDVAGAHVNTLRLWLDRLSSAAFHGEEGRQIRQDMVTWTQIRQTRASYAGCVIYLIDDGQVSLRTLKAESDLFGVDGELIRKAAEALSRAVDRAGQG